MIYLRNNITYIAANFYNNHSHGNRTRMIIIALLDKNRIYYQIAVYIYEM